MILLQTGQEIELFHLIIKWGGYLLLGIGGIGLVLLFWRGLRK